MRSRFWKAGNDEGSVALTMFVVMIATLLVVQVLYLTYGGLRYSRRAGDSANALQVADAGVNDAVKAINAITAANPDAVQFTGEAEVGPAGSYEYSAVKTEDVWRIEAVGTDPTGVQRRILADAVDMPLFGNAFFGLMASKLEGTADSYLNPTKWCLTSTDTPQAAGTVGSSGYIEFSQARGGGQVTSATNCRQNVQASWNYAADGCIFYESDVVPLHDSDEDKHLTVRAGACPPLQEPENAATHPGTFATQTRFRPQPVNKPLGLDTLSEGDWTCKRGEEIPRGTWLVRGSITLEGGCRVEQAGNEPAILYVENGVTIGTGTGSCTATNNNVVNMPYTPSGCNGYADKSWWEAGWAGQLQIFVVNGQVKFGQHAKFWGTIYAPRSVVDGKNHTEIWGSVVASSAGSATQFAFHYDVTLAEGVRTTQYIIKNWREEPLQHDPVVP